MIKIEINAENGADARKELIDLLGLSNGLIQPFKLDPVQVEAFKTEMRIASTDPGVATPETVITTVEGGEVTNVEVVPDKKKRRTKAEIEAEALATNTGTEEPPAAEVIPEPEAETPAAEATFPDLPSLQRACAILVRAGYKEDGIRLVKTIGGADSSKEVPEEKRQVLIDALVKFAEDNKIAQ